MDTTNILNHRGRWHISRLSTRLTAKHREALVSIENFLSRLDGVKETGHGKCVAKCPAHEDRSPSLAITEGDDGRVLIHCFAGCETEDVLSALGMTFSDVMPERIGTKYSFKPMRQRFDARQMLATLDHESLVVSVIGGDFLEHKEIDEDTWCRLSASVSKINSARSICAPARIGR